MQGGKLQLLMQASAAAEEEASLCPGVMYTYQEKQDPLVLLEACS
jgi:hypothetical protein